MTQTDDKVIDRLIKGGFVEARLPVRLIVKGQPGPIKTVWRVTGQFGCLLRQQVALYLVARGFESKETVIRCGEYSDMRLTAEGEVVKLVFVGTVVTETAYGSDGTVIEKREKGIDYELFTLVAGGPDGKKGVKPKGTVQFETEGEGPRFAVALSFAGENRNYVKAVDAALRALLEAGQVFYDDRYEHLLARPNLDTFLQEIYHDQSELLVVFLCSNYERKEWCKMEWRAIRDVIKKRRPEEVMLVRLDDTEIPGVFSIDGYVDARSHSPKDTAALIHKRLLENRGQDVAHW